MSSTVTSKNAYVYTRYIKHFFFKVFIVQSLNTNLVFILCVSIYINHYSFKNPFVNVVICTHICARDCTACTFINRKKVTHPVSQVVI